MYEREKKRKITKRRMKVVRKREIESKTTRKRRRIKKKTKRRIEF